MELVKFLDDKSLPILDIGKKEGSTGYIDFIKKSDLGDFNVVKGKDMYGRYFLTLKVIGEYNDHTQEYIQTFFQRYSNRADLWMDAYADSQEFLYTPGGITDSEIQFLIKLINGDIIEKKELPRRIFDKKIKKLYIKN